MTKLFFVFCSILVLAGCANTSADYYKAIQEASEANSRSYTAKMTALAQMAANGDPSAQGAAVMAMALSQPTTIAPQYIESQALSWARVLATPVAAVTGLYLQTDLAKHQSDNTARVQLGQQSVQINADNTNAQTIIGVTEQMSTASAAIATAVSASADNLTSLGVAGFDSLVAQSGNMTEVSTNAMDTIGTVSTSGFANITETATTGFNTANIGLQTAENISSIGLETTGGVAAVGLQTVGNVADAGFVTVDSVSTAGLSTVGNVSTAGLGAVTDVSNAGLTTVGNVSNAGLGAVTDVSNAGLSTVSNVSNAGLSTVSNVSNAGLGAVTDVSNSGLNTINTLSNSGIQAVTDTSNAGLQAVETLNAQTPIICSVDPTGAIVCN